MSKTNNYIEHLPKEKIIGNYPQTPCVKKNNKDDRIPFNNYSKSRSGSMSKTKNGNKKSSKKINKNAIKEQDNNNNYMYKNFFPKHFLNINNACNNGFTHKNTNSFGNIKDFNYYLNNNNNMNYNNISSNDFYNKKINNILNSDIFTKNINKINNNTDSNNINKAHSLIHNNSTANNNNCSYNYNTTNNNHKKNISKMKNINNNKRLSVPIIKNKMNKKCKNKGKPISLLENKNETMKNSNYNNIRANKNVLINKTLFNNFNIFNSNKRNILSNITYTNELYCNNNLLLSQKNDSAPVSMKCQINSKTKKKQKNLKEIKKSQSQSHYNYKISPDLRSKIKNNKSKSRSKNKNKSKINSRLINGSYKGANPYKKMIKNKTANLNLNKINDISNNFLNISNLIKNSFQKKNHFIKYPFEESKTNPYYGGIYSNIHKNNNLHRDYDKDLNEIKKLWEEIGGVTQEYQEKFLNYSEEYENRNTIFTNEINELFSVINHLNKLNLDILKRNEIVGKIKKINDNILEKNNFDEIKNLLLSLRILTIDVIYDYIKFFKVISYDILMNKFDINKIRNFDKNYLNKMKNDTNFLTDNNQLNKICSFTKNAPFFLYYQKNKNSSNQQNNNKLLNSIENDIFRKISKCEYILFKEKIYNNITPLKNNNIFKDIISNEGKTDIKTKEIKNNNIKNIKNENKISLFNISNRKSECKNDKFSYCKCNNFSYISIQKNEINNKTNKYNNIISEEINNIIINQNNNSNENISKINKKANSGLEKGEKDINNLNYLIESPISKNIKKSNLFDENFYIVPYKKRKDSSLSLLYKNYLSSVSENIKKAFNINNDIFYYSTIGIYPKILLFKDNSFDVKGICTLSYNENLNMTRKILMITSISCSKGYKISKILLNLINYFKNSEIAFDSIEINLYYIKNKEGNFVLDEELEKEIKSEAKFKWVRLENDGEKRKIKYHYLSNNYFITNKENNILNNINNNVDINCNNKYSINLKNYVLIKYYQDKGFNNITMGEHCHLFFIINLLKTFFLQNINDKEINNILDNFKGIKLKKIIRILSEYDNLLETNIKDFKNDYCSNHDYNMELLYTFLEIIEKNKTKADKESFICLNFNNIFSNFSNIIKIEIDNYEYNVISMKDYIIEALDIKEGQDIDEFYEGKMNIFNIYENKDDDRNIYQNNENELEKEVLYFIKSENENISLIFYEIKENNNNIINDNHIKLLLNKVLKKILVKDSQEPIRSYKKICIPSFSYKKRINDSNTNDKLKLIECDILDCNETFDFCIEKLSYNDVKFSFPLNINIDNNDEIKIIKNNFIVAVINNDLILDYHLPSMNIFYISKDKWIKIKK